MRRQLVIILLVVVAMVAASAAVVAFTVERLRDAVEPKSATTLEACLADNMVANLTASGEELINRACNERVRDRTSSIATCVFAKRDAMTSDDAARAIARQCGVAPTDL
jgi:anionic cell wall polymer biosynthesis LytR-Cps2A-Psr (LCP) family protein